MTAETIVQDPATPFRPGHCADHPAEELVTHVEAGIRWYGPDPAVVCRDLHHRPGSPERCRWCGGPLTPPGEVRWHYSDRRAYCSSNHRLRAFRARAAEAKRSPTSATVSRREGPWHAAQRAGYRNRTAGR